MIFSFTFLYYVVYGSRRLLLISTYILDRSLKSMFLDTTHGAQVNRSFPVMHENETQPIDEYIKNKHITNVISSILHILGICTCIFVHC